MLADYVKYFCTFTSTVSRVSKVSALTLWC